MATNDKILKAKITAPHPTVNPYAGKSGDRIQYY